MGQFAIGQGIPRTEDPRLLRGNGCYTDDVRLFNCKFAWVLRSPYAHAKITTIDTSAAENMPGVIAVLTGSDWETDNMGWHPAGHPRTRRDGSPLFCPPRPALNKDKVRVIGDAVAVVIANTAHQARDAAEKISVLYEPLPHSIHAMDALALDTPILHEGNPDNESYFYAAGDKDAVERAIANAPYVARRRLIINRITPATMEPRAAVAEYDQREDRYILYCGTQRPFLVRRTLAENVFKQNETKFRVMTTDVGGSFGMKGGHHPENHMILWASRKVGYPVRWISDRSDGMAIDYHDRDQITDAELAIDEEGKFLALRVISTCGIGAYLEPGGTISPAGHLGGLAGTYRTPLIYAESSAVFTNTACNGPFRGSGRPEAAYVLEQMVDAAAREIGMDRAEIRRRNFVRKNDYPFKTGLIFTLDCGAFDENQEKALKAADYDGFEGRRSAARNRGKLRGIGIANFIEQTAQTEGETVSVRFDPSGTVTVVAGSVDHGQGHDTMYKIVVSDKLEIDHEDIRVDFGDTDLLPFGAGTYASRTAILGSSAAARAVDKVIEKGKQIAGHILEAAPDDIDYSNGSYRITGTDRSISIKDVARASYNQHMVPKGMQLGLFDTDTFVPDAPTFPNGCHICEVEIDPETGTTEIVKYSVVDDVGTVINQLTLEGQIHGGIGQGVGQALTEQIVYDPASGQLLTGSFLDYCMPRADNMCSFDLQNNPVPTELNPIGAKGAGEAGNVGALAAIMNAVNDALLQVGVEHIDMPATPMKIWNAIQNADN
ncbi:MAG: xanthine dehydrogenase family protein molybdopterin-binding subunit [Rhodospirillaceae bacterium]